MKKTIIIASTIIAATTMNAHEIKTSKVNVPEVKIPQVVISETEIEIEYKLKESKISKGFVNAFLEEIPEEGQAQSAERDDKI